MSKFKELEEITLELFEGVVIYTIAEPSAMGAHCLMEFVKENGECFSLFYNSIDSGKITYADIKSKFPALEGCFWNGPMPDEKTDGEVVLFVNDDTKNKNMTRVAKGWKHIYTGCGNHLLIKETFFSIFNKYISQYESPVEIYCSWQKHIDDFINELPSK